MFKVGCRETFMTIALLFIVTALAQDRVIEWNEDRIQPTEEDGQIPEQLLIRMKDIRNADDLVRLFISLEELHNDSGEPVRPGTSFNSSAVSFSYSNRRANSGVPIASIAQPANCQPEQHVVELEKPENGGIIFWPSCVRVRRCGGCCTSKMLACQPTATSVLNVTILQMHYNHQNPDSFESHGTRTFSLEQHDRCACMCKERPEHCTADVQEYKSHECRCVCKNVEGAAACTGRNKIWDSKDCMCKCANFRLCSTGREFNNRTCRCQRRHILGCRKICGKRLCGDSKSFEDFRQKMDRLKGLRKGVRS